MKNGFLLLIFIVAAMFITSCEKDDPEPVNEEELITTVRVDCVPQAGGQSVELSFVDLDGDGGQAPVITGGEFKANTLYNVEVTFLNETETPAEDITEEVREEGDEHQVFLLISGVDITFSYSDADNGGNPIGLEMELAAGAPSTGQLRLILRHQPDKDASGVAGGDITNAGGETDVEVSFPVEIVD